MITKRGNLFACIFLAFSLLFFLFTPVIARGEKDFVSAHLRHNIPGVATATGYQVYIQTVAIPDSPPVDHYVTAWLGIDLGQDVPGVPFSALFTQIGIRSDSRGTFGLYTLKQVLIHVWDQKQILIICSMIICHAMALLVI